MVYHLQDITFYNVLCDQVALVIAETTDTEKNLFGFLPKSNRLQQLTKLLSLLYEIGFIDYRSRFRISRLFYSSLRFSNDKFSTGVLIPKT